MPATLSCQVGWIDTTIHDFLIDMDADSAAVEHVLITCLDSSLDVATIVKNNAKLAELRDASRVIGKGVFLATKELLAIERRTRLFYGFDEIWFFAGSRITAKPRSVIITGPNKLSCSTLGPIVRWMKRNDCVLGLGDGVGMNYCARIRGVVRQLVRAMSGVDGAVAGKSRASA